jgi:preprotein translocase subunit SecB
MKPSVLHIEGYYIKELAIELNESFAKKTGFGAWTGYHYQPDKTFKVEPPDFEVRSEIGKKVDDPSRLRYLLMIRSTGRKEKTPYSFKVSLVGYFHADKDIKENVDVLLYASAPSVLFAAAREVLAASTARGPYPAIVLPAVSFHDDAEELVAADAKKVGPLLLKAKPAKKALAKSIARKAAKK